MIAKLKALTEDYPIRVSVGLLILIGSGLVGGTFWLTTLYANTSSNTTALQRIESTVTEIKKELDDQNTRLSRLEGKVDDIHDSAQ